MKVVLEGKPENSMGQPDGVATVRINSKTGLRARPGEADALFEIFKAEELPPYADEGTPAGEISTDRKKEESLF